MVRSRSSLLLGGACLALAAFAVQQSLPSQLSSHLSALQNAKSVTGTLNVQPLPGTPLTVSFSYSKPNLLKIDTDESTVVCDGKQILTVLKAKNQYVVEPFSDAALMAKAGAADVWAYLPFFDKDAYKYVDAKAGTKRTLKGSKVTEVRLSWTKPSEGTATLYVDEQSGFAKGFNHKSGDSERLVIAENIQLGDKEIDAAQFSTQAPAGATKIESVAASKSPFEQVQAIFYKNCMPCHNAQNRKDGVDLSNYDAIVDGRTVVPGDPETSNAYRVIRGPRPSMPKNSAPLSGADVKTIGDWIKDGAKKS